MSDILCQCCTALIPAPQKLKGKRRDECSSSITPRYMYICTRTPHEVAKHVRAPGTTQPRSRCPTRAGKLLTNAQHRGPHGV